MSALSDILSLLDRWDQWKQMKAAPERLDALEKRVAQLEAQACTVDAMLSADDCVGEPRGTA